jgi:hypothetical protein
MLIYAIHAALEHAVEILDGVRMNFAATVFFLVMIHAFVACELAANRLVMARFISHQARLLADFRAHDAFNVGAAGAVDVEAVSRAAALEHDVLMSRS